MNSKLIVGTLVGGVILFCSSFVMDHAESSWRWSKYTAKQTEILQYLGENLEGEGSYFCLPWGTSGKIWKS